MCQFAFNPYLTDNPFWVQQEYASFENEDITTFHRSIPGYKPTPLIRLNGLAKELGVADVFVKDESHRFGLKAFKAMGASYAIYRFIKSEWEKKFGVQFEIANLYRPDMLARLDLWPFCTATDGNHGRAVAWFANMIGQKSVIYVPAGTVAARRTNIRNHGAQVVVIDGDYDRTVARMADDAERNGWKVISDTAYGGYTQIPAWIMAAYTTMFREIDKVAKESRFTHIFLQSGVGSFAGAAAWYYHDKENQPKLISVEPMQADCLLESIRHGNGQPRTSRGSFETMMAGLNCGAPSLVAWPLIRDRFSLFMAVSDEFGKKAMRYYYKPVFDDPQIISGESGAAGLAALLALVESDSLVEAKARLELDASSKVLLFNTEGDTDPDNFKSIITAS